MSQQMTTLRAQEVARDSRARPTLPRSSACAVAVSGQPYDVLMLGGYLESDSKQREATNEAWAFRAADNTWHRLPITANSPVPQARIVSQAVVVGQHVYLLAGWDPGSEQDGGQILADVWRLDLATNTWSPVEPAGEALPPISRFQACLVGDSIYIHTHRSLESILVLEVSGRGPALHSMPVLPDTQHGAPSSRGLHSLTTLGSRLYLFGGAPQRGPMLGDLWVLDTAQQPLQWQQLAPAGPAPPPRCSHVAAAVGKDLLILGGSYYKADGSGLEPLADAWALDTEALCWRQLSIQGDTPSARNAAMLPPLGGGQLLYHGGWRPFVETFNDTYILQLES